MGGRLVPCAGCAGKGHRRCGGQTCRDTAGYGLGGAGRADARGAASVSERASRGPPSAPNTSLQSPHRFHPVPVERASTQDARLDDSVVEDGADDRGLPVEVQAVPRSA
jgi:hypothetical protein